MRTECGVAVKEEYTVCPQCGEPLRAACPQCSQPVEPEWKVCPRCVASLETVSYEYTAPVAKKDRVLGKILLGIVLIPLLLIVVLAGAGSLLMVSNNNVSYMSVESTCVSVEDAAKDPNNRVWMDSWDDEENMADIHVLYQVRAHAGAELDIPEVVVAIYSENGAYEFDSALVKNGKLQIALHSVKMEDDMGPIASPDEILVQAIQAEEIQNLKGVVIKLDGKKVEADVLETYDDKPLFQAVGQWEGDWEE